MKSVTLKEKKHSNGDFIASRKRKVLKSRILSYVNVNDTSFALVQLFIEALFQNSFSTGDCVEGCDSRMQNEFNGLNPWFRSPIDMFLMSIVS